VLYRTYDDSHTSSLRKLNDLKNVLRLDIFTVEDWQVLQDRSLIYLTPVGLWCIELWDDHWREELGKIMTITDNQLYNLES
jgi:hypothetical protein